MMWGIQWLTFLCVITLYNKLLFVHTSASLVTTDPATTTCTEYLLKADINGDYRLNQNEFLLLLQAISCDNPRRLSWNQFHAFHSLACAATCHDNNQKRQEVDDSTCVCSITDPTATIVLIDSDGGSSDILQSLVCDIAVTAVEGKKTIPYCDLPLDGSDDKERNHRRSHRRGQETFLSKSPISMPNGLPSNSQTNTPSGPSYIRDITPSPVPFFQQLMSNRVPVPAATPPKPPLPFRISFFQKFPWFQNKDPAPAPVTVPLPLSIPPPVPVTQSPVDVGTGTFIPSTMTPLPPLERETIPTFPPKRKNKRPANDIPIPAPVAIPLGVLTFPTAEPTTLMPFALVAVPFDTGKPVQDPSVNPPIVAPRVRPGLAPQPVTVNPPLSIDEIPAPPPLNIEEIPVPPPISPTADIGPVPDSVCIERLVNIDKNQDNLLDRNEYFDLFKEYIVSNNFFNVQQTINDSFIALAGNPGGSVSIYGARIVSAVDRSQDQNAWLSKVCRTVKSVTFETSNNNPVVGPTLSPVEPPTLTSVDRPIPLVAESESDAEFRACLQSLVSADEAISSTILPDQLLDIDEYLTFVRDYSGCGDTITALSLEQEDVFRTLACECLKLPGASSRCCLSRNARIDIEGAQLVSNILRTVEQTENLKYVCNSVQEVLPGVCVAPPVPSPVLAPPTTSSPIDPPSTIIGVPGFTEACRKNLNESDIDQDGFLNQSEYFTFIQKYSKCKNSTKLTTEQDQVFKVLFSKCFSRFEGKCLFPEKITIEGANLPIESLTPDQQETLSDVCQKTDSALVKGSCEEPEPVVLVADDLAQCTLDLMNADKDGDSLLDNKEYLTFMRKISGCGMNMTDLHIGHWYLFQTLACSCRWRTKSYECCIPPNSRLNISGADLSEVNRTEEQTTELSQICITSRAISDVNCTPQAFSFTDDCTDLILKADKNKDMKLSEAEYIEFLREEYYQCSDIEQLSFFQRIGYFVMACYCMTIPGASNFCCAPSIAYVNITGIDWPLEQRTHDMNVLLGLTCLTIKSATKTGCQSLPPSPAPQQQSSVVDESGSISEMKVDYAPGLPSFATIPSPSSATGSMPTESSVTDDSVTTATNTTASTASSGRSTYSLLLFILVNVVATVLARYI